MNECTDIGWFVLKDNIFGLHTIQLTWSQSTKFTARRCAASVNDSTVTYT